jgi:hypothetical protein
MSAQIAPPLAVPTDSPAPRFEEDGSPPAFEGFDPPESNFWRLPNTGFEIVAAFTSWAEHKVVEYILRHTWGYQEYGICKHITMDEFMHGRKRRDGSRIDAGCGMAENSIKKGIADAVSHGFLVVEVDDSDRGRIKKYYGPRMRRMPTDEGAAAIRPLPQGSNGDRARSAPTVRTGVRRMQTPRGRGQAPIPGGQALTPGGQPLRAGPQNLPLQDQEPTPRSQQLAGSPSSPDPRTEQESPAIHLLKDTRGQQATAAPPGAAGQGTTAAAQREPLAESAPENAVLAHRLMAEGIAEAKAWMLVHRYPVERIQQQLRWIDDRRYQNRAATLIAAIERDYEAPGGQRGTAGEVGLDRAKYYRGAFALCPRCGSRPCQCPPTGTLPLRGQL